MSDRIAIAVLTGGYSGEAHISRESAALVMHHIDSERFEATLIHVDPTGWWVEKDGEKVPMVIAELKEGATPFAGAFIIIHGTPGEDGKLQFELDALGIPYSTGNSESVARTFHKGHTNAFLRNQGIQVAMSETIEPGQAWNAASLVSKLGLPCFVKPNEAGSSLGINRVEHERDLDAAIAYAMGFGEGGVLVESMLEGREFSVGIIPDQLGKPEALPVTEIRTSRLFFDYEAKYSGEAEEITPADLDIKDQLHLQDQAVKVYTSMGCRGLARVDMMLVPGQRCSVIEVNAVPGLSEFSIIPRQAEAFGLSNKELISRIIDHTILAD